MAACDVWKQTHKKLKNMFSSATTNCSSNTSVEELSGASQDNALDSDYNQFQSMLSSELVSNSLFITIDGNVIDSYNNSNDEHYEQFVEYWDSNTNSVQLKLGDTLFFSLFGDLLHQGQVNLSDCEPESDQDSDDYTVCGTVSSDDGENNDYNHFKHTHYNCIPLWEQQQQQYHDQHDKWNNYNEMNDPCTVADYANDASFVEQDQMVSKLIEQKPYQQADVEYNPIKIVADPCTIFMPKYQLENKHYGAHSVSYQQPTASIKDVHRASIGLAQDKNTLLNKLELEVIDAIFIPSTINQKDEITLPKGFYPLKTFLDCMTEFEQRFGDKIGVSIPSLNLLQLVFVSNDNCDCIFRPFVLHDDYDLEVETCSLQSLVYIFEDLDIEYGDMIGVSHFDNIFNPYSINNVTNMNNESIKSLLSTDDFGNTQSDPCMDLSHKIQNHDGLNTHLNLQCGMTSQHQYRSDESSQSIGDMCNNGEWNLMSFTFTKNNGECGGSGTIDLSVIVNQNKSQVATATRIGFDDSDTCSFGCGSICSSFSDTTSTNMNSSIYSTISCGTSTNSSNFEPLFTSPYTAQLQNNNKMYHRKHRNKRKRKRKKHKWIPKHKFFCVKDVINELFYYSHKYGNQVGVTKTSLDGLVFLMANDKNKIVEFDSKVQMQKLPNHDQSSNFYPLRSLINTLLELDVEYGNRIGITKQSFGKLKMLFIGYSIDEIDEVVTNNTNMFY